MAVVLVLVATLGITAGAVAQTSPPPSGQPTGGVSTPRGEAPAGSGSQPASPAPGASTTPGASGGSSTQVTVPRADSPAASPRTTDSETRIFGVSPTVAVLIAAALLVVVILAIVSMSRSDSTHTERIDIDRRL